MFAQGLERDGLLEQIGHIRIELYGSLGATGKGHGTDTGVMLGLGGEAPDTVEPATIAAKLNEIRATGQLRVLGKHLVAMVEREHILFFRKSLPEHPNGMRFHAYSRNQEVVRSATYLSVGGGFVVTSGAPNTGVLNAIEALPYPYRSARDLLALCRDSGRSIAELMWENETVWRSRETIRGELLRIWDVMQACVTRGCGGGAELLPETLPGPLRVRRRAPPLYRTLLERPRANPHESLEAIDWINLYAIAVNEENAAGGRVVTAPTNGAAGIIPAVLHYYMRFVPGASAEGVLEFLLTAAAIGILYKLNASISGAEVGCQGEVGVACSIAAAGLAAVTGGTPQQVENAAEIGMEHNLGLTCDPVGGLVQIPCIERNAMGAVKAVNAARIALHGDGHHYVSLDSVIETMRATGADMKTKYKETSRGGLAVHIVEC